MISRTKGDLSEHTDTIAAAKYATIKQHITEPCLVEAEFHTSGV
jgi:hypothetical protein